MSSWTAIMCHTISKYILEQSIHFSMMLAEVTMSRRHRIHGHEYWHFLGSIWRQKLRYRTLPIQEEKGMEKESRLLRVGVVGAGPISQAAHFEACRKARNAELYAICDLADDLVTQMAAIHHPHVTYLDYDEMLADPHVEAVIVATADQFHTSMASRALAAGKHVLVEKPLGVSVEECEALREQVQASG